MAESVALIDDDAAQLELLGDVLRVEGFDVVPFDDAHRALETLRNHSAPCGAVISDIAMPGMDGPALCRALAVARPDLSVILVTAQSSVPVAIDALRAGAYDFQVKPVDSALLGHSVRRALERFALTQELNRIRSSDYSGQGFLGESAAMQRVRELVSRVASSQAPVCIQGQTGTGKELVARALHAGSSRAKGPFIAVNCAALPAALLESELFGHEKGSFTDAKFAKKGLFLDATGGTLFLDEVAELAADNQAKLLRALQERCVRPVGGSHEIPFDARIVTATHKDLEAEVQAGRFRQDLFFRLSVVSIALPSLAERGNDVLELAQAFLKRSCEREGRPTLQLPREVAERLLAYDWPGNVRELENTIERCVALAQGNAVSIADMPERIQRHHPDRFELTVTTPEEILTLDQLSQRYIRRVLKLVGNNRSRAAKLLGIDRRTLYRRLDGEYGPAEDESAEKG